MNVLFSFFLGLILAIMLFLNGQLSTQIDLKLMSLSVHTIGLVLIILIMVIQGKKIKYFGFKPVYYLAGLFGVLTVIFTSDAIHHIGVTYTVMLSLFAQSLFSLLIDHFGWFGLEKKHTDIRKVFGLGLVFIGLILLY